MKKHILQSVSVLMLWAMPIFVLAETSGDKSLSWFIGLVVGIITQYLIPLLTAIALLVFIFGLARFILNAGDETKVAEGKQLMFWGIVALVAMISVWGIVGLFYQDLFGGSFGFPRLPISGN